MAPRPGSPEGSAFRAATGISLHGFTFSNRVSNFDWRLLHGINVDEVIRMTDVGAVEQCFDTLQHGNFEAERGLSTKNCVQLFRLLQLSVEYLLHLRNAHISLLGYFQEAVAAAERWKAAAVSYLDMGNAFLSSCVATGDLTRGGLDAVDEARVMLEDHDARYNEALDRLESEDSRARFFHFRKQRVELNWRVLHATDVEQMMANADVGALDRVLPNIVMGSLVSEDAGELTYAHFAQLIPLAQCALDLAIFQTRATGGALEQSMAQLTAACADIPMLTSHTQDLHTRITTFILEAQQAAQLAMAPQPASSAPLPQFVGGMGEVAGPGSAASMFQQQVFVGHRPSSAPGGRPGSSGGMMVPVGGMPWGAGIAGPPPYYDELLALSQAAAAAGGTLPAGALEVHTRTSELQFKVDALEQDLRVERGKTEEMRRMLSDIRDRLGRGGDPGPQQQPLTHAASTPPGGLGHISASQVALSRDAYTSPFAVMSGGTQTGSSPTKVRVILDEDIIRNDERAKAVDMLSQQVEALKLQALRQHSERRTAPAPGPKPRGPSKSERSAASASTLQLPNLPRDQAEQFGRRSTALSSAGGGQAAVPGRGTPPPAGGGGPDVAALQDKRLNRVSNMKKAASASVHQRGSSAGSGSDLLPAARFGAA